MNREMRRMQEREERRRKRQEEGTTGRASRKAAALQSRPGEARERKSLPRRIGEYLHEVRQELRKVTWPTQDQMVAFTTVTVITAAILTVVVFGFDLAAKDLVFRLFDLRD